MASKITTLYEDSAKTNALYPRTKQNAISDADGNPLTEVGFYTSETVGSGVDDVKVAFDMDLLWTNPSPTSNFTLQTVSVDLSDYSAIVVCYMWATSIQEKTMGSLILKGESAFDIGLNPTNTSVTGARKLTINETGIAFENAYAGSTESNNVMIPYKIYGIR